MKLNLDTIIVFVQHVDKLKSFYVDILKLDILEEIPTEWMARILKETFSS